jgi:hypothetical protein
MSSFTLLCVFAVLLALAHALRFPCPPSSLNLRTRQTHLHMVFGGIAQKMGSLVELVAKQNTINEKNIESTLKVRHFILHIYFYGTVLYAFCIHLGSEKYPDRCRRKSSGGKQFD